MATQVREQTGALFVVITNAQGIRLTHPNPALIGTPITYDDPEPATSEPFRTGRAWLGLQHGIARLGRGGQGAAVAERPAGRRGLGRLPGRERHQRSCPARCCRCILYLLGVLAVGVLAALALARRLKRQTFGLELSEIAALLQEREAMLHGIKEAVLGYDTGGRVLLANDAARDLLGLPADFAGRKLRYMLPPGRLADVVTGEVTGSDLLVLHADRVLVANRMPITRNHQQLGWVVTFQDRTESETLKRALDEVTGLADTLRAQSHEFANRLHTLVGLVELGHYAEAVEFVDRPVRRPWRADRPARRGDRRAEAGRADPGQGIPRQRARRRAAADARQQGGAAHHRDHAGADGGRQPDRQRDRRGRARARTARGRADPGRRRVRPADPGARHRPRRPARHA